MSRVDARQYNITVRFGQFVDEECYEAKVAELPDVAEYADTAEEAYALAIDTIETLAEMYAESKEFNSGFGLVIPANTVHNIINTGTSDLKLFSIYGKPEH